MDKPKYEKVIDACALKTDLDMFTTGDKIIIGEKVKSRPEVKKLFLFSTQLSLQ